ncbi:hypothetical protein ABLG96_01210 [Nakamurella sp. A5-74]|uniref:Uncharacterized protein n=1 Tax=Nakamurella sp. A5-74 TaxID=3158264 RepID=A0AAU8DRT4_9ACTN
MLNDVGNVSPERTAIAAKAVAVGHEYEGFVSSAKLFKQRGLAYFGTIKSRISWGPLAGDEAVIRDCMDQTKFGTYEVATKNAVTIGSSHENLNATFKRVAGVWRVQGIFNNKDESCR